ncbi:MAG: hypothetical protein U0800_06445 [Isosphaeraceae bacterium]
MTTELKATERPSPGATVKPPAPGKEMEEFLARSRKGDESCKAQARAILDDPERGGLFTRYYGSSSEWLTDSIARKASRGDVLIREAVHKQLAEVRRDLEGPNPTAVEKMLADRAALCWFVAHWHENTAFQLDNQTIVQADFQQRRIDRAHRRFLSAVETLARVRKLAVPILQLNIARNQQINTTACQPEG